MIDAMLAGFFFTPTHIAAIGVVVPVTIVAAALMNAIAAGVEIGTSVAIGAGDRAKAGSMYSLGMIATIALCTLFLLASELFAPWIVRICSATEAEVAALATRYLRFVAPYFLFLGIKQVLMAVLSVYGYQTEVTLSTAVELALNLLMSVILAKYTNFGIAALALGSWIATFMSLFCCIAAMKRRKLTMRISPRGFQFSDLAGLCKYGLPTSADNFARASRAA